MCDLMCDCSEAELLALEAKLSNYTHVTSIENKRWIKKKLSKEDGEMLLCL